MSFLLGDDYASSSEGESDAEEQVTILEARHEGKREVKKDATQRLPSADSVLASVSASTASYLAPKSSAKSADSVKAFDLLDEQETQRREQEKEQEQKRKQDREQKEAEETRRNERKRPAPVANVTNREQPAKREKKDAKERVKNQRVKGQAGIGSDFRGRPSVRRRTPRSASRTSE